jgi:archaellin
MAVTSAILLISILIFGILVFSVLSGSLEGTSEQDMTDLYDQLLDESIDEITTYLKVTDKLGKFYGEPHNQRIEKIAIMIKPLVTINVDISELTIKICDGNEVKILSFNGSSESIGSQSLFGHTLWDKIDENYFSFIATHDNDNSIVDYNTINKNSDMGYVIIKLPKEFYMKQGDSIVLTLFPETGITRTILLEAPIPIKSVVSLD